MPELIHASAVVESGAQLGADVRVGPFSYIAAGARIGDGSVIGPHVTIYGHTTLGAGCRVHAGAVLGDVPQDTGFANGESFVNIGARCVIREGVTVHRGTDAGSSTDIGDDCFLMAFSHCAHNVRLGHGVILANGVLLAGYVEVGDRAFLSGNAVVHQFVRIGRLAMLGGGSGASKDVPPFCTVPPVSLNEVVGLNVVGMRRAGLGSPERLDVKRVFRLLYHSGLNVSQACERIKADYPDPDGVAQEFVQFVAQSERGICGAG